MDELARQAGLSKRTVYRYFSSKEMIIEAVVEDLMVIMSREADLAMAQQEPTEILTSIVQAFQKVAWRMNPLVMEDLRVHYPRYWQKIDHFRLEKAETMIRVLIGKQNADCSREIDPRIITRTILAGIQSVLNPDFLLANNLTLDAAAIQLFEFYRAGLQFNSIAAD